MNNFKYKHEKSRIQRGSGLIEVILLIVIMGIGMLGMSKLQTILLKDGGTTSNRAIAASLAQEKLDDLRSFKWISQSDATVAGETCGTNVYCFTDIDTSGASPKGGALLADGSLRIPAGTVPVSRLPDTKTTFTLNWVKNAGCSGDSNNIACVTVTVSWSDPNGSHNVQLKSAIFASDIALYGAGIGGLGGNKPGPKIIHNPGATPDVIPIIVSDGIKREASKPQPDITQHALSTVTSFTTVNYKQETNQAISQDEYSTVNCTCTQSSTTSTGRTPSIGVGAIGDMLEKQVGIVKTSGQYNEQPALCTICCRDHHDKTSDPGNYRLYDPIRPDADYLNGDHKHYLNLVSANAGGSDYDEACRLKRINGLWYVMPDWRLAKIIVLPKSYLDNNLTAYQTAVSNFVKAYINAIPSGSKEPSTVPDFTLSPAPPSTVNIGSTSTSAPEILMARGIYIDHMTVDELQSAKDKIAAGSLNGIGFQEVNITRLARWNSDNTNVATVTSDALTNSTETTYSRGSVVKGPSGGTTTINATIKLSNSGLTDSRPIDGNDQSTVSGTITVSSTGGTPTVTKYVWGQFSFPTGSGVRNSDITVPTSQGSLSCTKLTKTNIVPATSTACGVNDGCYSCSTNSENWADVLKIEVTTTDLVYGTNYCITSPVAFTASTTSSVGSGNKTIYTTKFNFSETLSGVPSRQLDITFRGSCP